MTQKRKHTTVSYDDHAMNETLRDSERRLRQTNTALLALTQSEAWEHAQQEDMFHEITEVTANGFGVARVSIWFFNPDHTKIVCSDLFSRETGVHTVGAELHVNDYPVYFRTIQGNRFVSAHDARQDARTREFADNYLIPLGITSMLDAGIRRQGKVAGVVCLEHVGEARRWTSEEEVFAGSIADLVSLALETYERRRTEAELKQSVSRLHAALNSTADGLLIVDRHMKITGYNHQFLDIWHIPESMGMLDDSLTLRTYLSQQLRDPDRFLVRLGEFYQQPELVGDDLLEFKDGRCVERYSQPQQLDGAIVGRVWSFRDITERRHAEESLLRSEERLASIINSALDAIITIDAEHRIIVFNRAAERIFGWTAEAVIGKSLDMLIPERFREPHREHVRQFGLSGQTTRAMGVLDQISGLRANGEEFPIETSISQIHVAGEWYFTVILRDVTERISAEEQRLKLERQLRQAQKMEAIGTLAGGIAHDFNNILSGIIGYTSLLQTDLQEHHLAQNYLQEIEQANTRAKDLVSQILSFSRREEQELSPTLLQPIIKEALRLLRAVIPPTVEILTDINPETPPVLADATQIHQVIMNLTTNAVQALSGRTGRIDISYVPFFVDDAFAMTHPGLHPGPCVQLIIRDNGPGIDAVTLERIFEPFFTTKTREEGTGLGLSVVHGIVEHHQGAIIADSQLGRGTQFQVYFSAYIEEAGESQPIATSFSAGQDEQILYVDDEATLVRMAQHLLERMGYRMVGHTRPDHALADFSERPDEFDLAIIDFAMPVFTGLDLIQRLHGIRPNLPVILITGFNDKLTEDAARQHGVETVLPKPLTPEALKAAIHTCLSE